MDQRLYLDINCANRGVYSNSKNVATYCSRRFPPVASSIPSIESSNFDNFFAPKNSLQLSLFTFFTKPICRYQVIQKALCSALSNQEFNLCYQPQFDLNSNQLIGVDWMTYPSQRLS